MPDRTAGHPLAPALGPPVTGTEALPDSEALGLE